MIRSDLIVWWKFHQTKKQLSGSGRAHWARVLPWVPPEYTTYVACEISVLGDTLNRVSRPRSCEARGRASRWPRACALTQQRKTQKGGRDGLWPAGKGRAQRTLRQATAHARDGHGGRACGQQTYQGYRMFVTATSMPQTRGFSYQDGHVARKGFGLDGLCPAVSGASAVQSAEPSMTATSTYLPHAGSTF